MEKMGESQIIDFFSTIINDEFKKEFGDTESYSIGNFSGSQDREFADFFAGTDAVNVLIEFKEKKVEYKAESRKPNREILCKNLNDTISLVSRKCHFIGWGTDQVVIEAEFCPYIDIVCHIWNCTNLLKKEKIHKDYQFVQELIKEEIGVNHNEFITYINYLHKISGGKDSGGEIPFKSILYSYKDNRIVATRFDNLNELLVLRQIIRMKNNEINEEKNKQNDIDNDRGMGRRM